MNRHAQMGASLIIVLVVLSILLLGAMSMAKLNESSTLIAGNIAFKDASRQASEVGISQAFEALVTVADEEQDLGHWYYATLRGDDATGLPQGVDWSRAAQLTVGSFTVHYVIERQCTGPAPITDINAQCVIRKQNVAASAKAGLEALEAASSKQYRITVYVSGPKRTQTYVQTMVVR